MEKRDMSKIDNLVAFVTGLRYEDIPQPVIGVAKKSILDTLAATIAGSSDEGCRQLVKLAETWGGRQEATILVYGSKVPSVTAALVNCTMARVRELDEVHEGGGGHLGATVVPSAFVISELSKAFKNRAVSGKDFIRACVIGSDLLYRLRAAAWMSGEHRWVGETFAPIVVAAMGAKMLDFDEIKMRNAMGIAYAQCSGNAQAGIDGAYTNFLQQGFGARAGIVSVVLADQGFTGAKDILEGDSGLFPLYMHVEHAPEGLTTELGKRFGGSEVSVKLYPTCKFTHAAIYGALELAKEHQVKADDIESVAVHTSSFGHTLCGGEAKVLPENVVAAQLSYYYTVATALVKGRVFLESFTGEAIKDPGILAMARRIKVVADPEIDKLETHINPIVVKIETKGGKHHEMRVEFVKGHPRKPMSMAECFEKLKNCARFSVKPLSKGNIDKIHQSVEHLDELDDVTTILQYLG